MTNVDLAFLRGLVIYKLTWFLQVAETMEGTRNRFIKAMESYCYGIYEQVQLHSEKITLKFEQMMELRRRAAGVAPILALIE